MEAAAAVQTEAPGYFDPSRLDLSTEGVRAALEGYHPDIEKAVRAMESSESWTMDRYSKVQAALEQLAAKIEEETNAGDIDFGTISEEAHDQMIALLGYLSSGKAIRLLLWIDQYSPDFVAKTLVQAQFMTIKEGVDKAGCELLIERFQVLENMHLLSRVYAEPRLSIMREVLNTLNLNQTEEPADEEVSSTENSVIDDRDGRGD